MFTIWSTLMLVAICLLLWVPLKVFDLVDPRRRAQREWEREQREEWKRRGIKIRKGVEPWRS
jgi:hypothetical protein